MNAAPNPPANVVVASRIPRSRSTEFDARSALSDSVWNRDASRRPKVRLSNEPERSRRRTDLSARSPPRSVSDANLRIPLMAAPYCTSNRTWMDPTVATIAASYRFCDAARAAAAARTAETMDALDGNFPGFMKPSSDGNFLTLCRYALAYSAIILRRNLSVSRRATFRPYRMISLGVSRQASSGFRPALWAMASIRSTPERPAKGFPLHPSYRVRQPSQPDASRCAPGARYISSRTKRETGRRE